MNTAITVQRAEYADIAQMRELYRFEAHCQIVRDSILRRNLADAYLFLVEGRRAGYGGVWNKHSPGQIMEFYVLPHIRALDASLPASIGRAFVRASRATHIEAQTNLPGMLALLLETTSAIGDDGTPSSMEEASLPSALNVENYLFADHHTTFLPPPVLGSGSSCVFRQIPDGEAGQVFTHHREPQGPWGIEGDAGDGAGRRILATGGFLTHYNPPYGDIYMEVDEAARRKGVGAYLVQELKRICYEAGYLPACRCNANNVASRRTLQRAGFAVCGRILTGKVNSAD
jgi:GNAT superfamily N-acetyltransferase